jgi:hypothetical protein
MMAVSFKSFVIGICDAVAAATESLSNQEDRFLDSFFSKTHDQSGDASLTEKYVAKTVKLEAPIVNDEGNIVKSDVEIPLVSLVSHASSKIDKFTLKIDLQAFVENDELKVELANAKLRNNDLGRGTLEITISPSESSHGLKTLVESYENIIKNQIQ